MKPKIPRVGKTWGSVARFTHIGITYALAVLVGYFGGAQIDKWLHTSPILAIVGVFVMMGAGIYWMYLKLKAMEDEKNNSSPNQ
jgi:F0F1-type ATP synthase assembly protein I